MSPQESTIIPAANSEATTNIVPLPHRQEPVTPSDKALTFVREHPVLTIAGGLAVGLLVSALIPRRANRGLAKRTLRIAEAGAAAALSFGKNTLDKAEDGGVFARKKAEVLTSQAEMLGGKAAAGANKFGSLAVEKADKLSAKAIGKAERFGVAALETAGAWGHAAADRADKIGHATAEHAEKLGNNASKQLVKLSDKAVARSSKVFTSPASLGLSNRLVSKLRELLSRMRG